MKPEELVAQLVLKATKKRCYVPGVDDRLLAPLPFAGQTCMAAMTSGAGWLSHPQWIGWTSFPHHDWRDYQRRADT